ncbi:putative flavo protein-ubiquinone oxidoreductase [Tilletiaria anomala UBC 951]|uniref:Electron transfer flavoprotein-ubiquinone oxidoreductase n=1 Tax=Tilletiaria anomala (strain ATCC 24038 / CBS 436.72 / UBC 951) TaxID=1037660 RepID=A0A066VV44_TILAU|nr:putative flavo protein-ubiquinone oxidoreductase [Tilletiaria anomala UBC 951]KDN42400.1 putative flavo protein-ubiquinone oxidoreductase [Tilletiaria anomala UBC 951]
MLSPTARRSAALVAAARTSVSSPSSSHASRTANALQSCTRPAAAAHSSLTYSSSSSSVRRTVASVRSALATRRHFITSTAAKRDVPDDDVDALFDLAKIERVSDEADVVIVGGGPAGLSAAIRIKQLAEEKGEDIRVVLLEKGGEVGNHILSGAVIQTNALDELLPNWKELGAPLNQPATEDHMRFLTKNGSFPLPHPPQMSNKGNYIVSLSRVVAWLGEQAEAAGVEIYPGFAGSSIIWDEGTNGEKKGIKGIVTNEIGLNKARQPKDTFEPGMEFRAPITLFAEGAHGSCTQQLIRELGLREAVNADPQTYALGIKEVWKVKEDKHQPGCVTHSLGWPMDMRTYGGSWMYHMEDGMVSVGLVVALDYENPYMSPFKEFQRMKHHPFFKDVLEGGECLAYGARVLNEGGYQSIPKLHFPGGALIGCAAGFVNVPKIKGTHNAMKSGMTAAEATVDAILARRAASGESESESSTERPGIDLVDYKTKLDNTYVMQELKEVRNLRPSFHNPLGLYGGILYSGLDSLILKGRTPWTFHHKQEDYQATKPASQCRPIDYPKPDGQLSFDILTSVSRTGTNHTDDQPVHLVVKQADYKGHVERNVGTYDGLLGRVCPAAVYEYVDAEEAGGEDALGKKLVINSQNCIHCKTCSIKTPDQSITWTVPEGGGGPKYSLT